MADYPIQVSTNAAVDAATGRVFYPTQETRAAAVWRLCRVRSEYHPHAGPCGLR